MPHGLLVWDSFTDATGILLHGYQGGLQKELNSKQGSGEDYSTIF